MNNNIERACLSCDNPCKDKLHCTKLGYDYRGRECHPSAVYLLLTENCNLRCKYCFEGNSRNIKKIMSKETAFKVIDYLFEEAALTFDHQIDITFFGGEPMLNPKLAKEIIIYTENKIKDTNIKSHYSVITNGTVYNDDVEDFLNTWHEYKGNDMHVQLSYDGIPEIQSEGRPCADPNIKSSDLVKEVSQKYIEYFTKNNIGIGHIDIHSVLTKTSIKRMYDSYRYFIHELGIVNAHFAWVMEEDWDDEDVDIFEEQLNKVVNHLANITDNIKRFPLKAFDKCSGCSSGKNLICVDCSGNIYPCHRFFFYDADRRPNYLIGNINNEHDKIIDLEKVDRFRKFNPEECCKEPSQICIACNEYYTGDLGTMPNEYQIKFMKVINIYKERYISLVERKSLLRTVNSLNKRISNLEKIIFSLNDLVNSDKRFKEDVENKD